MVAGGVSRRSVLAGAGVVGGSLLALTGSAGSSPPEFYGAHQAGITTPVLPNLQLAGFDVVARDRAGLAELLQTWTEVAAGFADRPGSMVSVTFGFGPALFATGRFDLADRRPPALTELPAFPRESLDPAAGGGDLCIQVCAQSATAAHDTLRAFVNTGREYARLRWRQVGFREATGVKDPVGLFGFRDGTANLDLAEPLEQAEHLWVSDGPAWLHGGTYLVVRRIRLLLDTWDRTDIPMQEAIIGRRRDSNERLTDAPAAHAQLAAPAANGGVKLLRRSYSYDAGADPNGLLDAGLVFICFQRDPQQFVAVQQRLAAHDPLNGFSQHLASGVYACPPGIQRGSWVGAMLLA